MVALVGNAPFVLVDVIVVDDADSCLFVEVVCIVPAGLTLTLK